MEIVFIEREEVTRLKQLFPDGNITTGAWLVDSGGDHRASFKLLLDNEQSRLGDVVGGVHAGVGWCDDWHQMTGVSTVDHGVPDASALVKVDRFIEHDGIGPWPSLVDSKKPREQGADQSVGVQLTDLSCHQSPGHTARKADCITIDAPLLGPQLDASQGHAKVGDVGHQFEHLIGHSTAVHGTDRAVIKSSQIVLRQQV